LLVTEEQAKMVMAQGEKFKAYAPHFTGHALPEDSASDVLKVAQNASLRNGDGGAFVSHLGNKQWL
jgi:hypothetical protein